MVFMVVYLLWVNNDENMSRYLLYFRKKKTKQSKNLPLINWIPKAMVQFTDSRLY